MKNFFLLLVLSVLALTTRFANAQTFRVLHEFNGAVLDSSLDGANPHGALLRDSGGNLYGTTFEGGNEGEGAVYRIDGGTGEETVLFSFSVFASGAFPSTPLIQDQAGNLYGIADEGPTGAGVVFKLSQAGEQTLLHQFQGGQGRTARLATGGITRDQFGNIYGTTLFGGNGTCQLGCGTAFRLDSAGAVHILHTFTGGPGGSQPSGPLVRDAAGNLYGVTQAGGNLACAEFPQLGCGTVFRISKSREFTVLHTFAGGGDGAAPQPGLLLDAAGNLYGTTGLGGTAENGTVFRISSDSSYKVLHRFVGKDGVFPNGNLVSDPAGNLYGTTQAGGDHAFGTVFKLGPHGLLTTLHSFTGFEDGAVPFAGVVRDTAGHLYGTSSKNFLIQAVQGGAVFEITP